VKMVRGWKLVHDSKDRTVWANTLDIGYQIMVMEAGYRWSTVYFYKTKAVRELGDFSTKAEARGAALAFMKANSSPHYDFPLSPSRILGGGRF